MRSGERAALVAFLIGLLLLSYPLVNVANSPTLVLGIPMLYLYLFALWLVGIGIAWLISRGSR
jgi:hypothetical protein